jgi:hypothetical protein
MADLGHGTSADRVGPERADHEAGDAAQSSAFVSKDMSASSALTRERLGWNSDGPTLHADIRAMTAKP